MTKTTWILAIAAPLVVGIILFSYNNEIIAQAQSNGDIILPPNPSSVCPPSGQVQHWDKIIFKIKKDKTNSIPPEYLNTDLDLKILDPPGTIVNLKQEIINHLKQQFFLQQLEPADVKIDIVDVRYEVITCGFTGPEGPQGPEGSQGPEGPPAEITLYRNERSSGSSSLGEFVSVEVLCDEGDLATGGGFVAGVPEDRNFYIKRSLPLGNPPTSWFVQGKQIEGTITDFIIAYVVCIDQTP